MNLLCAYIRLFQKVVGLSFTRDTTPTSCIMQKNVKMLICCHQKFIIKILCHNVQLLSKTYTSYSWNSSRVHGNLDITVMPWWVLLWKYYIWTIQRLVWSIEVCTFSVKYQLNSIALESSSKTFVTMPGEPLEQQKKHI